MSDPTGKGLSSLSLLLPHTSDTNCKPQLVTCTSDQLAINWGSHEPLLGFNYSLEWLTELRETLPHSYWCLIKDILRGINEEPGKEIHRSRSRKVPNSGASVPAELGCVTLLIRGCVRQPASSVKPLLLGFYGGLITETWSTINSTSRPSSLFGEWGQGWKFQVCNHSLVLLVDSPHPEAHQEQKGLLLAKKFKGI